MSDAFEVRIEWLDAPDVRTPELSATWARYEIWVNGRCATQVEADETFRRSVYGSLYPFAEWIASNWWTLSYHVRPSAVDSRYWRWPNLANHPWLRNHNLRAAGDGMAWPDLTVVPEGSIARIVWAPDSARGLAPVRFAAGGMTVVRTDDLLAGLASMVNAVVARLAEQGYPKTRLTEEWDALASANDEEREFCRHSAQLGLDPYSIDDETATAILAAASKVPADISDDFFDSADPARLDDAADWTLLALEAAGQASTKARDDLGPLYAATAQVMVPPHPSGKPWIIGYEMARRVRQELGIRDTEPFDVLPWLGTGDIETPSNGIHGVARIERGRCGLVLGSSRSLTPSTRLFRSARALGRALAQPGRPTFMLSAARRGEERVSGAFAAELLAPAEGIRQSLDDIGSRDEAAFESVAWRFGVSPLVVRHQYDNQLGAAPD